MAGMLPFNWEDPFDLEGQLTEEERMIRDLARGFAQSELQPRVQQAYRDEVSAPELFPLMGAAGMLGATVPEEYGGAGAELCRLRIDRARDRTGGFRLPVYGIGPVQPGDVSDPCHTVRKSSGANICPDLPAAN